MTKTFMGKNGFERVNINIFNVFGIREENEDVASYFRFYIWI